MHNDGRWWGLFVNDSLERVIGFSDEPDIYAFDCIISTRCDYEIREVFITWR